MGSLIFTIVILGVMFYVFVLDEKKPLAKAKVKGGKTNNSSELNGQKNVIKKTYSSTQDNLPFKSIKSIGSSTDKALIIKDNDEYVGIIEVNGINYNLLSVDERLTLEEVFQKLLNGLDYPIELFIQSRNIDIENYNLIYEKRLDELKEQLKREKNKYSLQIEKKVSEEEINDTKSNIFRLTNQIEYGEKIKTFINNITSHSDILEKKYYIAISYKYNQSNFNQAQTEDEKFETAFNTISNRVNSILTALAGSDLTGKMLNGYELAELLYVSFNKKDSNKYKLDKAIKSGFNDYVITSRPVEYKILENEEKKLKQLDDLEEGGF